LAEYGADNAMARRAEESAGLSPVAGAVQPGAVRPGDLAPRRQPPVYAAIDLGTNNCRLLIARADGRGGFRVVDAFSRIVRLGEGLAHSGRLAEAAQDRAIEALAVCAQRLRRRQVTHLRAIATEAVRKAENGQDFVARVRAETGLALEMISAAEEAQLAVDGCLALLDPAFAQAIVFDIGGGSTEIAWLDVLGPNRARVRAWTSLPLGVVTLADRHGGVDVPTATYQAMVNETRRLLDVFEAKHGILDAMARRPLQMLGTSGTVTTLAGVQLGLKRYDRARVDGVWLDSADVEAVAGRLIGMSYDARVAEPCVGRDRADLVIPGCAILEAIVATWPTPRLRVADRGLREGMLLGLMRDRPDSARTDSARNGAARSGA
jgi:exopolyphosphatase/guanosine-5'-triphosphate,3'-diphosphate pyrophosphatase